MTIYVAQGGASGGSPSLAGDSDVTVTSPALNQGLVYNGSRWVNSASLLTVSKVLLPSGGDDTAAINAALNLGGGTTPTSVVLFGGTFTVGASGPQANGAALSMPSNTTLILWDAKLKLANAAGCPAIMNANPTAGTTYGTDTNLAIVGIGQSTLDGNASQNPHLNTGAFLTQWKTVPWLFVGVTNWTIKNLTLKDPSAWGFSCQNTRNGAYQDIISSADNSTANQSPIQIYGQNTNIHIRNLTGNSHDDCIALLTYTKQQVGAFVYPTAGNVYPGGDISNITATNVIGSWNNGFRVLAGDFGTIKTVRISGFHNINPSPITGLAVLLFGPTGYVTRGPGTADLHDITLTDWSFTNATGNYGVNFACSCSNVRINNGEMGDGWAALIVGSGASWATDLQVTDVSLGTSATGDICAMTTTGDKIVGGQISNIYATEARNILNNASATITDLDVHDINVETLVGAVDASTVAEGGTIDRVTIGTFSGTAKYAVAMAMRMGLQMPIFKSADTTPVATAGSFAVCDSTKQLDGGAATAAVYAAGGTTWTRVASTS